MARIKHVVVCCKHYHYINWCRENNVHPNGIDVVRCADMDRIKGLDFSEAQLHMIGDYADLGPRTVEEIETVFNVMKSRHTK